MTHVSALRFAWGVACLLLASHRATLSFAQTFDFASTTCASTTVVSGAALSIITAGTRASFTITARDSTSRPKAVGGDAFVLALREDLDRPLEPVIDMWNGTAD
jgi:hypothetical protein